MNECGRLCSAQRLLGQEKMEKEKKIVFIDSLVFNGTQGQRKNEVDVGEVSKGEKKEGIGTIMWDNALKISSNKPKKKTIMPRRQNGHSHFFFSL